VNLLADESVDRQIVDRLREDGHLVRYLAEMGAAISDEAVLDLANRAEAVLFTADKIRTSVNWWFASAGSRQVLFSSDWQGYPRRRRPSWLLLPSRSTPRSWQRLLL
jgi:hypothetical protein